MARSFSGKRALVTGASMGIGAAIARTLALGGAEVVLASRSRERLEEVAAGIRDGGGRAAVEVVDLSLPSEAAALAVRAGPIDILVNNAAATLDVAPPMALVDTDDELWDAILAVNLKSAYVLARELARGMSERGEGSIVNISSTAGSERALPGMGIYSVSKAALNQLTKVLAMELGPAGVRANTVSPGMVATPALEMAPPEAQAAFARTIPLGRVARPYEVASVVAWLVSEEASYVSGQTITVDGAMTSGAFAMHTLD